MKCKAQKCVKTCFKELGTFTKIAWWRAPETPLFWGATPETPSTPVVLPKIHSRSGTFNLTD